MNKHTMVKHYNSNEAREQNMQTLQANHAGKCNSGPASNNVTEKATPSGWFSQVAVRVCVVEYEVVEVEVLKEVEDVAEDSEKATEWKSSVHKPTCETLS